MKFKRKYPREYHVVYIRKIESVNIVQKKHIKFVSEKRARLRTHASSTMDFAISNPGSLLVYLVTSKWVSNL